MQYIYYIIFINKNEYVVTSKMQGEKYVNTIFFPTNGNACYTS